MSLNRKINIDKTGTIPPIKYIGVSDILKWLDDPCTEHDLYLFHCEQKSKYDHRKDCPFCWQFLKENRLENSNGK